MEDIIKDFAAIDNGSCLKKKRYWIDILLVVAAMVLSLAIRLPAFFSEAIINNSSEYVSSGGSFFLRDMDSYYFTNKMRIILGECEGELTSFDNLLPFVGSVFYRIINSFSYVSIEQVAAILGPLIFSFSCVPAYIFVRRITNRVGGIISALLIGISPALVSSTGFMIFDTDIFLTFLPMLFALFVIFAIESEKSIKRVVYSILSILTFIVLCFAWHSAYIYFYFFFVLFIAFSFACLIRYRFKFRKFILDPRFVTFLMIFLGLLICYFLLGYFRIISDSSKVMDHFLSLFSGSLNSVPDNQIGYPDSSLFVSELQKYPFIAGSSLIDLFSVFQGGYVNMMGGLGIFCVAILMVVIFIYVIFCYVFLANKEKNSRFYKFIGENKKMVLAGLLLVVWFLGALLFLRKGVRFVKIVAIPVCLLCGSFFGIALDFVKTKKNKVCICILMSIVLFPSLASGYVSLNYVPGVDKTMEETAEYIDKNFNDDTIIMTWWDMGYYYEFKNLQVIFDGGNQGGGYLYWVGQAFMTNDAKLSAGIFRMLGNDNGPLSGPSKASELFDGDLATACEFLKYILKFDKYRARDILEKEYNFNEDDVNILLEQIYPSSYKNIVIVATSDMIKKYQTISYYGRYNFGVGDANNSNSEDNIFEDSVLIKFLNREIEEINNNFKFETEFEDPIGRFSSAVWLMKNK